MSAMCPEKINPVRQLAAQKAFALPTAIFLLVVLAALGAFMLIMSSVQHTTSAQDVQGTRAYQAARAGIEWGVYQIMIPENANPVEARADCFSASAPAFGGTLAGFTVNVTCVSADAVEGENTIRVFRVTSKAFLGAEKSVSYVEREISATVSTCRKTTGGGRCDL